MMYKYRPTLFDTDANMALLETTTILAAMWEERNRDDFEQPRVSLAAWFPWCYAKDKDAAAESVGLGMDSRGIFLIPTLRVV